jgi:D-tyrosyl-tRNA(Tyr) deacylase
MRAVVQRVRQASVSVQGEMLGAIDVGLVVLLGIGQGDGEEQAQWMANKIANLRIFSDENGKMNRSVLDIGGRVLLISQFTLYGDARKGNRPGFTAAALPDVAEPLVNRVGQLLVQAGVPVASGRFQAHMLVEIQNDGPVTIILENRRYLRLLFALCGLPASARRKPVYRRGFPSDAHGTGAQSIWLRLGGWYTGHHWPERESGTAREEYRRNRCHDRCRRGLCGLVSRSSRPALAQPR